MSVLQNATLFNTRLVYLHQIRIRSQIIYSITVLAVIVAMASLPFLHTTISIKSSGLIQSTLEKTELLSPGSGRLLSINLRDNQKVIKGATLLIIDGTLTKQQNSLLSNHTIQLKQQLQDTEELLKIVDQKSKIENSTLKTGLYIASLQQYTIQLQNAANSTQQAERIYYRYQSLYQKKVITLVEFEQYKFNFEQAQSEQQLITKKYKSQWQSEANQYRNELRGLQNQKVQLIEQEKQYTLRATISGSVQNLTGLQAGSYVYENQKLGEISPDGILLAYCFVKPSDIGLIKKGQVVRFHLDAFNYNQWGMLTGKVIDISNDAITQNQIPYFKVKCQLDKNYMQLKNGYKGYIKKGMTFNANFTIVKRSLYQLLYDKIDDWVFERL